MIAGAFVGGTQNPECVSLVKLQELGTKSTIAVVVLMIEDPKPKNLVPSFSLYLCIVYF